MNGTRQGAAFRCPRVLFSIATLLAFTGGIPLAHADNDVSVAEQRTATGRARIDEADLRRHVGTLASDAMEGRQAGSRGGKAATAYLRTALKAIRESLPSASGLPAETSQEFGREYQNLLVLIPGKDDVLRQEVVIVGAHYDHVGLGNPGNSQGPFGQIHNGADDNASGTAAVLELIEAVASLEQRPARTILFAFWDAEEAGLLGSKHWVAQPTLPLQQVRFVLNLDMLGHLRDGRVVTVGWRSAPGLRELLATHNREHRLQLAFQPRVNADSDHHPFYAAGIPILHLDTDKHPDYHRPSDDPEKINWTGLQWMTEFACDVLLDLANRPELPAFRREAFQERPPAWLTSRDVTTPPTRLGIMWDEELAKTGVIQITQFYRDSPAAAAGLRIGDRIVQFGPWENGTIADFKTMQQVVRNPVTVRALRAQREQPIDLRLELWGAPIRLGGGWTQDAAMPQCAVMTHVIKDSPADRAGLAAGDVIMAMGGRRIGSTDDLKSRITEEPGPFHFRVERSGQVRDISVTLMEPELKATAAKEQLSSQPASNVPRSR